MLALAALSLAACGSQAAPDMVVKDAWARSTVAGQKSTAVYLTIGNGGGYDRINGVSSQAGDASLHSSSTEGGVARMRPIDALEIGSNATVELEPGGTHVMIMNVSKPLAEGGTLPLDLTFERSGKTRVDAAIRSGAADRHGMAM